MDFFDEDIVESGLNFSREVAKMEPPLGKHLLLELYECDGALLNNLEHVRSSMVEAALRARATIIDVVFHEFNPFGISGTIVIAESHLAIHTWPEYRYAAVDCFSCSAGFNAKVVIDYLAAQFRAGRMWPLEVPRGLFPQGRKFFPVSPREKKIAPASL